MTDDTVTATIGFAEPMRPQDAARLAVEVIRLKLMSDYLIDRRREELERAADALQLIADAGQVWVLPPESQTGMDAEWKCKR